MAFYIEMTDTFGGELNYSWVKRFYVRANTMRGAVSKLAKTTGYHFRKDYGDSESARYNVPGACVAIWATYSSGTELEIYTTIATI